MRPLLVAIIVWLVALAVWGCRSPAGPSVESYAEACESGTLPPDSILCAACYTLPYAARHDGDDSYGLRVCQ